MLLARKYRLTIHCAITAIALTAAAAILVNIVVGNLAEDNLIRIAEKNTAKDGSHIQSMMRGGHSMDSDAPTGIMPNQTREGMEQPMPDGIRSGSISDSGKSMDNMQQPNSLDLETLSGPDGLPSTYSSLVAGMNIIEFSLLDPNGAVVWSTDPRRGGRFTGVGPQV